MCFCCFTSFFGWTSSKNIVCVCSVVPLVDYGWVQLNSLFKSYSMCSQTCFDMSFLDWFVHLRTWSRRFRKSLIIQSFQSSLPAVISSSQQQFFWLPSTSPSPPVILLSHSTNMGGARAEPLVWDSFKDSKPSSLTIIFQDWMGRRTHKMF